MTKKRNRVDSRAHTPCPLCDKKVHGARGLKMHLAQMHDGAPIPAPQSKSVEAR